jgi:hypothetical protein
MPFKLRQTEPEKKRFYALRFLGGDTLLDINRYSHLGISEGEMICKRSDSSEEDNI